MSAQKGNTLIILVIAAALVVGLMYLNSSNKTLTTQQNGKVIPNNAEQSKTFKSSSVLKFSIELPEGFKAEEKLGSVNIGSPEGQIYIDRNGTNFSNLADYLKDLEEKNRFILLDKKSLQINGLSAIAGQVGKEKSYFIYTENVVYNLTAKTEALFDDLDQIAQSFKYTP